MCACSDPGNGSAGAGMRGRTLQIPGDGPAVLANGVARRKREARELDRDEESYFSEDVDEEEEVGGVCAGQGTGWHGKAGQGRAGGECIIHWHCNNLHDGCEVREHVKWHQVLQDPCIAWLVSQAERDSCRVLGWWPLWLLGGCMHNHSAHPGADAGC
jgi:hypothetical protein